ncbi:MAG TPA: hypothetical protein VIL46_11095 [Gemmataceae bacterium]
MIRTALRAGVFSGAWLALAALLAAGCGPAEELPPTYVVKGKVVFKNGKPMQGGVITFVSVTDPELRGYGQIGPDGTFTLNTIAHTSKGRGHNLAGAVEGEFEVTIRPGGGDGGGELMLVSGGASAFKLRKRYKVEPKELNEITVVVE